MLRLYLRDIARYKPLSSADEFRCAALIRGGDNAALEKLVRANLRFVVSVAHNYQHQGMLLSDIINEGNLGLMRAARRFDERKNFRFISYAVWWIRQGILQALANQSRLMRFPLNRVSEIYRFSKTRAALEQRLRHLPSDRELADELGISEKAVTAAAMHASKQSSLDAPVQIGATKALIDLVPAENHDNPEHAVERLSLNRAVTGLLASLTQREQIIMSLYFGIGKDTAHTLEDIGSALKITRERVRQIRDVALNKLKQHAKPDLLDKREIYAPLPGYRPARPALKAGLSTPPESAPSSAH
jgi:RNA polymerase primary sigma factor